MWTKRAGVTLSTLAESGRVEAVTAASTASRESRRVMCEKTWTLVAPVLRMDDVNFNQQQMRNGKEGI